MVEINTAEQIEVNDSGITAAYVTNSVEVEKATDLDIRVAKKEYSIVGDDVYVPRLYDDAPQWMKDLVQLTVDVSLESGTTDLVNQLNSTLSAFATSYVPLNQYTQSIVSLQDADTAINSVITTLNSTYNDGIDNLSAQIIELQSTKANATEVVAQIISTINSELISPTSNLNATIGHLQQTIANESSARALNFETISSTLETLDGNISGNASAITTIETYVGIVDGHPTGTGILADVEILQKQNDGVIETYTGTYDVMIGVEDPNNNTDNDQLDITQEPYASWLATDVTNGDTATRAMHVGDVYIKYSSSEGGYKNYERAYKFIKTIVDTTSPYATDSEGFTWALIVDTDAQNAYVAALNAYDLADDKRRIYVGLGATVTPSVPYDQGDLWLIDAERTVNGYACKVGDILRCIEDKGSTATYEQNDWVLASSYANAVNAQQQEFQDWIDGDYSDELLAIQSQIDSKAESYYQETMPHAEGTSSSYAVWVGDLWKKPSDNTEYVYQLVGSTYKWVLTDVPDIVYDTIDGKKTIFTGNDVPTAIGVNDMWITGDNPVSPYEAKSIYVWNGSAWVIPVKYTDDTLVEGFLIDGNTKLDLTKAYISTTSFTEYVANEIDKEVVVYSGSDHTTQTGMKLNDIYIEKTTVTASSGIVVDVTNTYKYNGTAWVAIGNNDNIIALADLTDGKRSIYRGTTTPQVQGYTPEQNDIWIPETGVIGYDANELYQYIGTTWTKSTKYTDDSATLALETGLADGTVTIKLTDAYVGNTLLTDYVTTQIDDQIGVYSGTTAPISGQPSGVQTDDIYLWFTTGTSSTGTVYDVTVTYKYNGTSWVQITTNDGITALADLADGKRTVFAGSTIPTGAVERDLWIPEANVSTYVKGEVYQYLSGVWTLATKYTEDLSDFVDEVNNTIVPALENQIDGKIEYWFNVSTDDPKDGWTVAERANRDGDVWYQVDTKASYYYTSDTNSWNAITDKDAIQALADAAVAKSIADSKITSYYIDTYANVQVMSNGWTAQQKLDNVGDLATVWNDSTLDYNGTWRWNGTSWVNTRDKKLVSLASEVTTLNTELSNGTNTWASADSTLENSLQTEISSEGARVEAKFGYNNIVNINGIYKKSGFGLTTNYVSGSGTEVDPYVSEFWIDASRFKFTNSNQTGSVAPFTIDATGTTPQITFNGKVSFNNVSNDPVAGNLVKFSWYASSDTLVDMKEQGWVNYSGSGETYLSPDGLKIGNNSGNDQQWLIYDKSIPINPNKRYKVTVEAQQTAGSGTAYFGFAGRNYNDTVWVNGSGANSTSSQYYLISSWDIPTTMTTKESSYWSVGNLVEGSNNSIRTDVVYYRPLILVNYIGAAGTTIIKSFKIEELEATVDISGDIGANNETFAQSLGFAAANGYTAYENMVNNAQLGKTLISGGYIGTGLVKASSILANSVSADRLLAGTNSTTVWTGGGLVSANFNGNPYGNIGSPTQGFRLSSDAAGTSNDPNIYGAYIKAAILEGTALTVNDVKVKAEGYPNNFGSLRIDKVSNTEDEVTTYWKTTSPVEFVSSSNGAGYDSSRMCTSSQKFLAKGIATSPYANSTENIYLYAEIEVSFDGGTSWNVVSSKSVLRGVYVITFVEYIHNASSHNNILFRAKARSNYGVGPNLSPVLEVSTENHS